MTETTEEAPRNHDQTVAQLCRLLINSVIKESATAHGENERERLTFHVKNRTDDSMMGALTAFAAHRSAQAAERQAAAMETVAKAMNTMALSESNDLTAQAIVDEREPKRDYLATTYSLPTETLMLLWSVRGMLMDASVKSLSRPDRMDPYRKVTTEELAWSLRMTPEQFWQALPQDGKGGRAFDLLEAFDIMHYGGTDDEPDDWMYGG